MAERLARWKEYTDFFLGFVQDFLDIFLVAGVGTEWEQVVKIFAMGMILILMLGILSILLRFMTSIIGPAIEALGERPDYLLFAVLAALLVFFTTPVSFTAATIALLIFVSIFVGLRIYQMQYFPDTLDKGPIWAMGTRAIRGGSSDGADDGEDGDDRGED